MRTSEPAAADARARLLARERLGGDRVRKGAPAPAAQPGAGGPAIGDHAEQVRWLEEGRVYAFRSPEDALAAATLLASGLEIDNHEARELAGLPVLPRPIQRNPRGRLAVIGALAIVGVAAAIMLGYALRGPAGRVLARKSPGAALPAPWKIKVVVQNGSGDINYTRRVASQDRRARVPGRRGQAR